MYSNFQSELLPFARQDIGTQRSDFIVNPEWVSEALQSTVIPFEGRKYGPIPYEYPGARYWPFYTRENKERYDKEKMQYLRCKTMEEAGIKDDDRRAASPAVHVIPLRDKTLPATSLDGYVVLPPGCGVANNDRCSTARRPQSVPYSRHSLTYEGCRYSPGYEEYYDHSSPYHQHQPDDVATTGGSHIRPGQRVQFTENEMRQAMTLRPDFPPEQRPRFSHPYLNTANAMWIGAKFPDSPAQN